MGRPKMTAEQKEARNRRAREKRAAKRAAIDAQQATDDGLLDGLDLGPGEVTVGPPPAPEPAPAPAPTPAPVVKPRPDARARKAYHKGPDQICPRCGATDTTSTRTMPVEEGAKFRVQYRKCRRATCAGYSFKVLMPV